MRIGFVVNPIAGMGGSVGLKGTDGDATMKEALARGARKQSPERAFWAAEGLRGRRDLDVLTCSGEMGKDELDRAGVQSTVVFEARTNTSRDDTVDAVRTFLRKGSELVVFAGGDGTARDVLEGADRQVPIIGVPAGVKMHSAVFANSPEEIVDLLDGFLTSKQTADAEVMDVDEQSFREGVLRTRLYGYALVPDDSAHMQTGKVEYASGGATDEAQEICQYLVDAMDEGVAYIVGPGTTTAGIGEILGQDKTLLGVDVFLDRRLVLRDACEKDLISLLRRQRAARIIVTPIGAQGFFFGRGNQQISADVIGLVGRENVVVVATPTKLRHTPTLRADTGDKALDDSFTGMIRVVIGYRRRRMVRVA